MSPFEILMLVCFGISWPVSIYKSWTSRSTKGKSLLFMMLIFIGYIGGIVHKIFYAPDVVVVLYALNLVMVGADCILYFRNRELEKRSFTEEM
ncbi:MAG: hypothetical protein PHO66_03895 [Eubacteriales bacterium]|nr:hypothetical protein [Eubacteriales bacterium]